MNSRWLLITATLGAAGAVVWGCSLNGQGELPGFEDNNAQPMSSEGPDLGLPGVDMSGQGGSLVGEPADNSGGAVATGGAGPVGAGGAPAGAGGAAGGAGGEPEVTDCDAGTCDAGAPRGDGL